VPATTSFRRVFGRRDFVRDALGVGLAAALPGCRTGAPAQLESTLPAGLAWLAAVDPLALARAAQNDFLGDVPQAAHKYLRDAKRPAALATTETATVVVVGGGLAGLAAAYLLKELKPVILEQAPAFGGVARGETWAGVAASFGSLAFPKPDADGELQAELFAPLGLDRQWRAVPPLAFPAGPGLERLRAVAAEEAPDLKVRDLRSLDAELGTLLPGPLLAQYCLAVFGAAPHEVSAAAGLERLVADVLRERVALPGGNARLASSLLRALANELPAENFRVGCPVQRIDAGEGGVGVQWPGGALTAKAVVVAAPKFIAKRVVTPLADDQLDAMAALRYRAVVVANLALDRDLPADRFELLTDGGAAYVAAPRLLTLLRAVPAERLLRAGVFPRMRDELAAQAKQVLASFGIKAAPPAASLRVARFGHALPLPAPGLLATGTAQRAAEPVGGRIFFCNQDDWAVPSVPACLTSAVRVARQIRQVVA
jgi:glycine/D-amino acid oxidase-like deaminating enzyme